MPGAPIGIVPGTPTSGAARAGGRAGQALVGAPDAALGLLVTAQDGPLDALQHARVGLLRGHIAFASRRGSNAPSLLLEAAGRLEPLDAALARGTSTRSRRRGSPDGSPTA